MKTGKGGLHQLESWVVEDGFVSEDYSYGRSL
jgi:hypothetical protein